MANILIIILMWIYVKYCMGVSNKRQKIWGGMETTPTISLGLAWKPTPTMFLEVAWKEATDKPPAIQSKI